VTCDEHPALRMLPKEIKLRIYGRLVKLEWYELISEKCGRIKGVEDIQKQGEPVGAAYQ
jgi:hypothetical protein